VTSRIGYAARRAPLEHGTPAGIIPARGGNGGRPVAPCSFAQEQFWFVDQLAPGNLAYNFSWPLRLRGALDDAALERALAEVVRRHESLRTGFAVEDGRPVQVVGTEASFALDRADVSGDPDPEAAARRLVEEETRRPFDLRSAGLFRAQLVRVSPDDHVLQIVVHHIVFDEWSKVVVYEELGALYDAFSAGRPSPLPEPEVQYAEFAEWQRSRLTEEALRDDLAYWVEELADVPTVLELPADRARPAVATLRGARRRLPLPSQLTRALEELAREEGVDLFDAYLALYELLLYRYTGQSDFVVGVPVDERTAAELDRTVGVLLGTSVVRSDVDGTSTFRDLLQRVRLRVADADAHADLPFELLVRELQPERDPSRHPLYQVLLAINPPDPELRLGEIEAEALQTEASAAGVDLFLFLQERDGGLDAIWEYSTDLFERETIERLHGHFVRLLQAAVESPGQPVGDLALLGDDELQRVLVEWQGVAREYPSEPLHSLIEEQVARSPDAVATVFEGEELTYGELNERANQTARRLQALGAKPGTIVAVSLERSLDLVVALLATLKAGAAYVPIDPDLPADRVAFMLSDSGAEVLITHDRVLQRLPRFDGGVVQLDADAAEIGREDPNDLGVPVGPDDIAYVIYTSGSTGRPKGVLNTHRGVVNRLLSMQDTYALEASDRLLQKTQSSFDVAVREVFWPLLHGARIVLAAPGQQGNPSYLAEVIEREQVTIVHFVPSMLQLFLDEVDPERYRSVRCVLSGGEALRGELANRFFASFDCELHNLYGPTEAAISVTSWRCEPADERVVAPLGHPVANTQMYVVDARLRPVPAGVWGELLIGGAQVARGYHGRPALTAEQFVPNPFGDGRVYRTGDRGRWTAGGVLEFGGRVDDQVKVRGFRVELGEIEAVLREQGGVVDGAVVAVETPGRPTELAGYVVPSGDVSAADVHGFLRSKLPDYMVPASITFLDELPLMPNGKLDKGALPAPDRTTLQEEFAEPETESERALARIWSELLELERVGRNDNFFTLGGHSLLAVRLLARVAKELDSDVFLSDFLREPTVAALAGKLGHGTREPEPELPPLVPRGDVRECSFAQERFWFVDQVMGASAAYNIPVGLRLRGELKIDALERALAEVVRRHQILRTRFQVDDGRPVQVVQPAHKLELPILDLSALTEDDREREAKRRIDEQTQTAFELTSDRLFSVQLLRLAAHEHVLHFVFNHIVFDGWSKLVLFRELEDLYSALATGTAPRRDEPGLQFADFAEWQRSWLQGELLDRELAHWTESLAGAPDSLELPTDRQRPEVASLGGAWSRTTICARTVEGLKALSRREGVTLYMTLLGVFDILLQRYSGQDDISVGMPVEGRDRTELEDVLGVFVDTVVLRVDLSGDVTFRQLLERVRARVLDAIAHQRLPFEQLVRALEPDRQLARHPLYQVMLTLVPGDEPPKLAGLQAEEIAAERASSPIDLTVFLEERGDAYDAVWEYSTDLFDAKTIERMQRHFARLLDAVVQNPNRSIGALEMLSDDERDQALAAATRTSTDYAVGCLHELFERQVAATPDAPALTFEGETLCYAELNARANRVAHALRDLGVEPETLVALCLERSLDLVVAVLGVLKAGGAYVPLDPDYPADRVAFVLSDSAPRVLLTQERLLARLPEHDATVLCIENAAGSGENPESTTGPENLAYVIYTSGSTGKPKGVQVEHRQVARLFTATDEWYRFGPADVWTMFHSYAFDFSVWELWGALLYGGRLVVPPLWTTRSPEALAELLAAEQVTVFNATPTLFVSVQDELIRSGDDLALRYVVFGGEALRPSALRPWYRRFRDGGATLVNMYGITETTVHVTYRPLVAKDFERDVSPIGEPIPDLELHLLDQHLNPVPVGVPGELFVGGSGVARGYLNRPELTAERFIPSPFGAGRLYRSGDTARYREHGEVEFLGRNDDQVKIRGFRIELGEIEAALTSIGTVARCAVVPFDGSGDTRLAAYVVPAEPSANTEQLRADLREGLGEKLPAFMVPASLTILEELPLTSNGKLDRKALPAPVWEEQPDVAFVAPRTPTEIAIAEIWCDILDVDRVGVQDNFFHLGGHSLLAARVVTQVRKRFAIEISVRAAFQHPTLAGFAELVAAAAGEETAEAEAGVAEPERAYPPSFSQQQLLFIDELAEEVATYNGAFAIRIDGELDRSALAASLADVVDRHESLRTVFRWEADGPAQVVFDGRRPDLAVVDVAVPADLQRLLREEARRPFDLANDLMVRTTLFALGPTEHVLLVVTHHIASDGWSVGIFCRDLGELYNSRREGTAPSLPELGVQFRDFVLWQRSRLSGEHLQSEQAYWRARLAGAPTVLRLPTDRPRSAQPAYEAQSLPVELPREVADGVAELCRSAEVTPYVLLLSVFGLLLYRLSGQDDILVGGPYANRTRDEYDDVIGFFANTMVMRIKLAGNPTFSELTQRVGETVLEALDHQEFPFEQVVDAVRPQRQPGVNPLVQVNFRVRVDPPVAPELEGAVTTNVPIDVGFAAFELALDLQVLPEGISGELIYDTDLFDRGTAERLAGDYVALVRQVVEQPQARLLALSLLSEQAGADETSGAPSIRRFRQAAKR
jgi:amino acid adenylation domain-containing protein